MLLPCQMRTGIFPPCRRSAFPSREHCCNPLMTCSLSLIKTADLAIVDLFWSLEDFAGASWSESPPTGIVCTDIAADY